MDAESTRKRLESDILDLIADKLQNGQMDIERASAIARMLLDKLHPPLTLEQIYAIVPTLDDEFIELSEAILPVRKEHDEAVRAVVAHHAEKLIQSGKFDDAYKILHSANEKTI